MTLDRQLLALVTILAIGVGTSMVIHWFIVCRELYKNGYRFPTGFLFWRQFHELRLFRSLRSAQARSVTLYYIAFILIWFNLLLLIGVVARAIYERMNPYG